MILFSPGPANISKRVKKAATGEDINHRGLKFEELFNGTRKLLLEICPGAGQYTPIIFTGSGTAAIEASIVGLKGSINGPLFVVSNGVYSQRAFEIAVKNGIDVHKLEFPHDKIPDTDVIAKEIERVKPAATYLVHHETGTGILNPIDELAAILRKTVRLY